MANKPLVKYQEVEGYYTPIYGNVIIAFMTIVIIIWCVYKDHYVGPFAEA